MQVMRMMQMIRTMWLKLFKLKALALVVCGVFAVPAFASVSGSMVQSVKQYRLWLISDISSKLLGKRAYVVHDSHTWGGKITRVYYNAPTEPVDEDFDRLVLRNIYLEIVVLTDNSAADKVDVPLSALHGMEQAADYPNAHISVKRGKIDPDEIKTPKDMILAGFPNVVLTAYDNGYLQVFVEGIVKGKETAALIYLHFDDANGFNLRYNRGSFH